MCSASFRWYRNAACVSPLSFHVPFFENFRRGCLLVLLYFCSWYSPLFFRFPFVLSSPPACSQGLVSCYVLFCFVFVSTRFFSFPSAMMNPRTVMYASPFTNREPPFQFDLVRAYSVHLLDLFIGRYVLNRFFQFDGSSLLVLLFIFFGCTPDLPPELVLTRLALSSTDNNNGNSGAPQCLEVPQLKTVNKLCKLRHSTTLDSARRLCQI